MRSRDGPHARPSENLPTFAEGLRWALAAVLVLQFFLRGFAPTVFDIVVALIQASGSGVCGTACDMGVSSVIPWGVFLGAHFLQIRVLRRLGPFPYSNGQVVLMALLPGYNLYGSVALFSAQAEAMERLGGGRSLGFEIRAATAMASGLAVALIVVSARAIRPLLMSPEAPNAGNLPGTGSSIMILSLVLLLLRLYVLARLQIAHRLVLAQRSAPLPAEASLPTTLGLPGARTSVATTGLALLAGGLALFVPPTSAWKARPPIPTPTATATVVTAAAPHRLASGGAVSTSEGPADANAGAAAPAAPEPPPSLPSGYLLAGRTVDAWRERLSLLRARNDEEGKRLFTLTRDRAVANGLLVTERDNVLQIEPSAERIAAARAEAGR
jgi:hypothetical protein